MAVPAAIAIRGINDICEDYKTYVEPYALAGEKFPSRLDVWFQDKRVLSITCPPTTPEDFESTLSRLLWACATVGGTNVNFVHRAEVAISSTLNEHQLEVEPTECMCVYDSSFLHATGLIVPFHRVGDPATIEWGQSSLENLPISDSKMLQVFLYNASQINVPLVDPDSYIDWLESSGYIVEFYEPYTRQNFSYDNN